MLDENIVQLNCLFGTIAPAEGYKLWGTCLSTPIDGGCGVASHLSRHSVSEWCYMRYISVVVTGREGERRGMLREYL